MNTPSTPSILPRDARLLATILAATGASARPLLLTGGTVITMNPIMGDWANADVLIGGKVVVGVGPGLLTAAGDDNMIVIDCAGTVVMPSLVDFGSTQNSGTLTPGTSANIAVIRLSDSTGSRDPAMLARRGHLEVVIAEGEISLWDGVPMREDARIDVPTLTADQSGTHIGTWVDENNFLRQKLLPDGRYDEARGDRPSAYRGRYWVSGTRIDYLDDLGFWAFGEFKDGTLHHAGYRLTRR